MEASWYMLHIRPAPPSAEEGKAAQSTEEGDKEVVSPETAEQNNAAETVAEEQAVLLRVPQVGTPVVHFLGIGDDEERKKADLENPLWEKIQDEARPAWAPDFLRLGFTVVFKRDGLPKLAVRLGLKNPKNVTKEDRRKKNRVLTFDDVWVIGVVPHMRPMYFPDKDLKAEDWWLATKQPGNVTSPYLVPNGATVATGAQRLSDMVIEILRQPENFPRIVPTMEDEQRDDYSEFINPLVPVKPMGPLPDSDPTGGRVGYDSQTGTGWAGLELYKFGR